MKTLLSLLLTGLLLVSLGGCGRPRLKPEDLGEVIYDIPAVPGAEKPYPLPQLEEIGDNRQNAGGGKQGQAAPGPAAESHPPANQPGEKPPQ